MSHFPKNILILGAGSSGIAAAKLAAKQKNIVTLLDEKTPNNANLLFKELQGYPVQQVMNFNKKQFPDTYDLIIVSPGIALDCKLGRLAAASGAPICSELAYAAQYCPWPMLAITGTNGKTTTVEMLTHCLNTAQKKAIAGGNIGLPLSQIILDAPPLDYVILEISSFQLEQSPPEKLHPQAAAVLNITPDHLNRHHDFETYKQLKLSILKNSKTTLAVYHENLQVSLPNLHGITFSAQPHSKADFQYQKNALGQQKEKKFCPLIQTDQLPFIGLHNYENALAVLAIAFSIGIAPESMLPGLKTFRTGAHRIEKIAQHNGVTYINDSKATNVDAVIQALLSIGKDSPKIILIAGGVDKKCSLKELVPYLQKFVKQIYLIGACRDRLNQSWQTVVSTHICESLEDAVQHSVATAKDGDIVLLSPACASQDMFKSYIERGNVFTNAVKRMTAQL